MFSERTRAAVRGPEAFGTLPDIARDPSVGPTNCSVDSFPVSGPTGEAHTVAFWEGWRHSEQE